MNGDVVIGAPEYADSLLITCPPDVARALVGVGLEVHEVDDFGLVPIWTD